MKKILLITVMLMASVTLAKPTHYVNNTWYECNQYDLDSKGNKIHMKNSNGYEWWYDYDSKGNMIHEKWSDGDETWYDYDYKGNKMYEKSSSGYEAWYDLDSKGNKIHMKNSNGYEWWYDLDSKGNMIHMKNSNGYEAWYDLDSKGNMIHEKRSSGTKLWYKWFTLNHGKQELECYVDENGNSMQNGFSFEFAKALLISKTQLWRNSGCGKTTIARAIATSILGADELSITEINASSDNGIDMTRQVQEALL